MNLIDFHVTEIISEEQDKVWKLYGMSEKELEKEKEDEDSNWVKHLLSDGLKQAIHPPPSRLYRHHA